MKNDQVITMGSIEDFLKRKLSTALSVPSNSLDINQPLTNYGLDSMSAVVMVGELEEWLDIELPSTLLWDYPTISELSEFLVQGTSEKVNN